jgi:hypothetical protein
VPCGDRWLSSEAEEQGVQFLETSDIRRSYGRGQRRVQGRSGLHLVPFTASSKLYSSMSFPPAPRMFRLGKAREHGHGDAKILIAPPFTVCV